MEPVGPRQVEPENVVPSQRKRVDIRQLLDIDVLRTLVEIEDLSELRRSLGQMIRIELEARSVFTPTEMQFLELALKCFQQESAVGLCNLSSYVKGVLGSFPMDQPNSETTGELQKIFKKLDELCDNRLITFCEMILIMSAKLYTLKDFGFEQGKDHPESKACYDLLNPIMLSMHPDPIHRDSKNYYYIYRFDDNDEIKSLIEGQLKGDSEVEQNIRMCNFKVGEIYSPLCHEYKSLDVGHDAQGFIIVRRFSLDPKYCEPISCYRFYPEKFFTGRICPKTTNKLSTCMISSRTKDLESSPEHTAVTMTGNQATTLINCEAAAAGPSQSEPQLISKRKHHANTPEDDNLKRPRTSSDPMGESPHVSNGLSYADLSNKNNLAICNVEYPSNPLTKEQMDEICDGIMQILQILQPPRSPKPSFHQCSYKTGYISFVCLNDECAPFLNNCIPKLTFTAAKLKVVDEYSLSYHLKAVAFIPKSRNKSPENIVNILENQNYGFNFEAWKVIRRSDCGGLLVWSIDMASGERLMATTGPKLSFGFTQVAVKLITEEQSTDEQSLIEELSSMER